MIFSVQMDDELGKSVAAIAKRENRSRNSVVKDALREYVHRHEKTEWPPSVREHLRGKGVLEDIPAFESYRDELLPPREIEF